MSAAFQSLKAVFNAGELTPLMDGRVDSEKYQGGCRTLQNMIVRPYGGVYKRPGTEYCGEVKDSADDTRLMPFRRSTEVNFVLEVGDEYIRFWYDAGGTGTRLEPTLTTAPLAPTSWATATAYTAGLYRQNGGLIYECIIAHTSAAATEPGVGADWETVWDLFEFEAGQVYDYSGTIYYVRNTFPPDANGNPPDSADVYTLPLDGSSDPIYEVPAPWDAADVFGLHFCQLNDVMFITHPDYEPQRLSRYADDRWVLEPVPFQFAPTLDPEANGVTLKMTYDAPDWVASTSYVIGDFVLYLGVFYRCKTANSDATFTIAKWDVAIYKTSWNVNNAYAIGSVVEYLGVNYFAKALAAAADPPPPTNTTDWVVIPYTDYRIIASASTFTADEVDTTWLLQPGSADRLVQETIKGAAGVTIESATVFIQGGYLVRTEWPANTAPTGATIRLRESLDRLNFTTIKEWTSPTAVAGTISYTGEAQQQGAWYKLEAYFSATVTADTRSMIIEPTTAKLDIPMHIDSVTNVTNAVGTPKLADDRSIPNEVLGVAFPIWRRGAFSESRGYPRTVAFHSSRLWFAGTATEPARLWASQVDDFYIFQLGTLATSGIDITIAATQANQIVSISSFNRNLVVFTTGEEWTVGTSDTDSVLTPSNLQASPRTKYGSDGLQAQLTGDSLLWAQRGGRKVREFAYEFSSDSFTAPEMTLLAEHITFGGIKQMAYASNDDPILWCIINPLGGDLTYSGLIGFSYNREQQVTAWHKHRTAQGQFESVATIFGTMDTANMTADQVWFVVKRFDSAGATKRYVERFSPRMSSISLINEIKNSQIATTAFTLVDCASKVVSTGTVFTGFDYIAANAAVAAWTSGGNVDGTNTGGTLTFASSVATGTWVGVPITSVCQPMPIQIQLKDGTTFARRWQVSRIAYSMQTSTGGQIGANFSGFNTLTEQIDLDYEGSASVYKTGIFEINTNFSWADDAPIAFRHITSGPFYLLAAVLKCQVSGD